MIDLGIHVRWRQLMVTFGSWWDGYRVTLTEIERGRGAAAMELRGFVSELGYAQ